jgi:hypothetical protein
MWPNETADKNCEAWPLIAEGTSRSHLSGRSCPRATIRCFQVVAVVDPQVGLNTVSHDQLLKTSPRFVAPNDTREGHASTEAGGDHGDGGCATEPVFLFVHADHDAWLFGVQLRGVTNQVAIQDQVADDGDVGTLAGFRHEG